MSPSFGLTLVSPYHRAALFKKAYGSFLEQRERKKRAREQAAASQDTDRYTQTGKLRKKFAKKVGVVGGANSSASQAAVAASRSSVKGASKKINYEALQVSACVPLMGINTLIRVMMLMCGSF